MYTIEEFDKQKTKILKYIIFKKRSENEIRNKFSKTIEENLLDDIIEYLKEAKYIDDTKYIERTIEEFKLLKNLSQKEVQYKLIAKGLDKNLIEDYIYSNQEDLEEYEIQSATNIINKKIGAMEKEEIKQYLIKKGYKIDSVKQAFENE